MAKKSSIWLLILASILALIIGAILISEWVSQTKPQSGDIIKIEYLGTDSLEGGRFNVAIFYAEYWSETSGGAKIGAKLFVPKAKPPNEGWPVKVWLHGFGGPGFDFWHYPYVEGDWKVRGYLAGMVFASNGVVSLNPWVTGAGPSEPIATYSPFSLERNAQTAFDGFKALNKLESYFNKRNKLVNKLGRKLKLDNSRQIMSTNCISSPTLIYFAAHVEEHPEVSNLKALVADTFLPSAAYLTYYILPLSVEMEGEEAARSIALWAGPPWCLAEDRGWDLGIFFTEKAIELFETPVETPAGTYGLMRASQLEPLEKSTVGPVLYEAVKKDLGHDPNGEEILNWTFSKEALSLLNHSSIEELLNDEFYRKYLADADPFFEQNIEPFSVDIPLFVIGNGDTTISNPPLPSPADRFEIGGLSKIETLRSWGWNVSYFYERGLATTGIRPGPGFNWVFRNLKNILYPGGLPEEMR